MQAKQLLIINYILFSMKKNLLKWMMAMTLVATPLVFTGCGSDDDGVSNDDKPKATVSFSLNEKINTYYSSNPEQAEVAIETVKKTMLTAMFASVGQTYNPNDYLLGVVITIAEEDEAKMFAALDAKYAEIKDTEMYGGYYKMEVHKAYEDGKVYQFGEDPDSKLVIVSFEDQQLNAQNFWIGDGVGTYSYTEQGVTVSGYQGEYEGTSYWSGFAISGRTETTYENLTPDQYNAVTGKAYAGDKFLVVQGSYNPEYSPYCITFDKPMKVDGMYCTNSAYAYSSMTKGDTFAGEPFTKEDWLSAYITCYDENDNEIAEQEVKLAEKDKEGADKYINYWKIVRINKENVKKITFSFAGSRSNDYGLLTPAYMCVDRLRLERQ